MENRIPFETQKQCRFLMFELDAEVVGFPYMTIQKLNWTKPNATPQESLEIQFAEGTILLQGVGLKRLLPLIQSDEIFIIRTGELSGDRAIKIAEIAYEADEISQNCRF